MWIFAYGSLVFRPSFAFLERRRAFLNGYARRFWQGSPDHRGVPAAPGRVATLVAAADAVCGGCAYRIEETTRDETLRALDERERAGFVRRSLPLTSDPGGPVFADALVYVADTTNPHFLGALPEEEIARWVRERRGPSGENADYVRSLHRALRELEIVDEHIEKIVRALA